MVAFRSAATRRLEAVITRLAATRSRVRGAGPVRSGPAKAGARSDAGRRGLQWKRAQGSPE